MGQLFQQSDLFLATFTLHCEKQQLQQSTPISPKKKSSIIAKTTCWWKSSKMSTLNVIQLKKIINQFFRLYSSVFGIVKYEVLVDVPSKTALRCSCGS